MTLRRLWLFLVLMLIGIMAFQVHAFAQTTTQSGSSIDWTPLINQGINLALPVVAAFASYLINKNIKDQRLATMLGNAVQNAVGIVQQTATKQFTMTKINTTTNDPNLNAGIQYIIDQAPEALKNFGITPEMLADKLRAKLGLAAVATNLAMTASAMPVIAGPLAHVDMGTEPIPLAKAA